MVSYPHDPFLPYTDIYNRHGIHLASNVKGRNFTLFEYTSHINGVIGNDGVVQEHRPAQPLNFLPPLLSPPPTLSTSKSATRTGREFRTYCLALYIQLLALASK